MGSFAHLSELRSLQNTLNQAIDSFEQERCSLDLPELSTYTSDPHPLDDLNFLPSTTLFAARRTALGQDGQLKVLLQSPYEKVVEQSCAVYDTACLDIFVRGGLVDELATPDALLNGRGIDELHQALDLSPKRISVIFRLLAAQGWLREVTENTFVLNRPALQLRRGSCGRTWSLTPGKPKVASSLLDFVTQGEWKYSVSPAETAFQISHGTSDTLFQYLARNPDQFEQWSASVRTYGDACHLALMEDYPWHKLTQKTIVDCGAGLGSLVESLVKLPCLSDCNFVAQDLPQITPSTTSNLNRSCEDLLSSRRITIESYDFFSPQQRAAGAVIILKHILHNWPDHDCVRILQNAALEADPETKILIIDNVVLPSTVSGSPHALQDGGAESRKDSLPEFLPRNYGAAAKASLALGVHMMGVFNGHERTLAQWEAIAERSGLHIDMVYHVRAPDSVIECSLGSGTRMQNSAGEPRATRPVS
ncbi:hypothetical protein HYDPIDRAFT_102311 [Hydnomerulius pinastri MD-312]|uniref:O-methyltransferase C-terminal domain-containing protein n=1 Tax=Hydnomerulius pinastri MD-312 TaxID=994086 RepID=A0A0C9W7W1_9AGAM|nr:hypothetical protein HYDPIDRAFT_102311 [Hydnomerulius pinastri MD-312]